MVGEYRVAPIVGGILIGVGLLLATAPVAAVVAAVILIWYVGRRIVDVPWPWQQ